MPSRNVTNVLNWILDNLVPPILRDNNLFTLFMFKPLFGKKSKYFMEFKSKVSSLSNAEIAEYYELLKDKHLKRPTDLNKESIEFILENIQGEKVLDIASGRGYLSEVIVEKKADCKVYGIDFLVPDGLKNKTNPCFIEGSVEDIPFDDNKFDTTICAHTLEHIFDIERALKELRRVTKKRLIIIVPRQREYKYTFDLHVNFFPYVFSLKRVIKNNDGKYLIIKNDIVYVEDF